jgi:proton-translocating NADH-quinone oxidoreductase chain L
LGIFAIGALFQAVDYATIFAVAPRMTDAYLTFFGMEFHALTLISLLLFVGAVGKSAQVGLHTWLPDAMEGPTPVSALIHAATMVTAGVFLLARCSPLLEFAPDALHVICIFGALTAFLAATTGLAQNDLKRVIAYSTCSQLGYMVFACGLSQYGIAVFHLANHAFFKALLFLGAGSVIHGVGDEQDMRKMGGLRRLLPFTYGMIVIGSLALMGTPFLTGFYSKDAILESAYATHTQGGHFAYYLGSAAAFATAFYSMRLLCLAFLRKTQGSRPRIAGAHEGSPRLLFPLAFLAIPSICIGYIGRDFFVGMGSDAWGTALFTLPGVTMMDGETLPFFTRMLPLFLSFGGAAGAWYLYKEAAKDHHQWILSDLGNSLYTFANRKWFFDRIYNVSMNQNFLVGGYKWTYGGLDRGLLEGLGPSGLSSLAVFGSRQASNLQTGQVYHSALLMLVGMTILMVSFQGPEWIYSMLNPCWLGIWGSGAILGAMLSKSK